MKLWATSKKFMFYGFSGYHYQARLLCPLDRKKVTDRLRQFYLAHRGVFRETTADGRISFTRGKKPWCWLCTSETMQPQVVDIVLSQHEGGTCVDIDFHVTNCFGLLVAPCRFDDEIKSLRGELEKQ
jgi:hypothetical protein